MPTGHADKTPHGASPARQRFLLVPRRGAGSGAAGLGDLLLRLVADPGVTVVRTLGSAEAPVGLLIETTEERAAALQRDHGAEVAISRDTAIEPLPDPGPRPPGG